MSHTAGHSGMDWKVALAIGLLGFGLNGLFGYVSNDKNVGVTLGIIQAHQTDTTSRLDRLENKLDHFIELQTGMKPDPSPTWPTVAPTPPKP